MKPEKEASRQVDSAATATNSPPDTNMKPSMVVQQQRQIQMGIYTSANHHHHHHQQTLNNNNNNNKERPHSSSSAFPLAGLANQPDQTGSCSIANLQARIAEQSLQQQNHLFDQNGLVLPKKVLPHSISGLSGPAVQQQQQQRQPIMRDLNRELKFNQVRGKNVLDKKSELKRAMEKLEESRRKKEAEQERLGRRSSLELRLEERAERIAKTAEAQPDTSDTCKPLEAASLGIKSAVHR